MRESRFDMKSSRVRLAVAACFALYKGENGCGLAHAFNRPIYTTRPLFHSSRVVFMMKESHRSNISLLNTCYHSTSRQLSQSTKLGMDQNEEDDARSRATTNTKVSHNEKSQSPFMKFLIPIWNTVTLESDSSTKQEISDEATPINEEEKNVFTKLLPIDSINEIISGLPSISFPIPFLAPDDEKSVSANTTGIAKPFQKYMIADKSQDGFGPLLPLAERIDDLTGGWGLSYADLAPETPSTPVGVIFLATNVCYAIAGIVLSIQGDLVLGTMTELAGGVSLWYHYSQLKYSGQEPASEVRLALLTDYIFAGTALITGLIYAAMLGISAVPFEAVLAGAISVGCLATCWVYEYGVPYIFWHSLWHIFSAYTGYLIGRAHLESFTPTTETLASLALFEYFDLLK